MIMMFVSPDRAQGLQNNTNTKNANMQVHRNTTEIQKPVKYDKDGSPRLRPDFRGFLHYFVFVCISVGLHFLFFCCTMLSDQLASLFALSAR